MINSQFFKQKTVQVAHDLIGCFLVVGNKKEGAQYQITETEAYLEKRMLLVMLGLGRQSEAR